MGRKILLNLICTNKYTDFLPRICESTEKFFFPDHEVSMLIHTNKELKDLDREYPRLNFNFHFINHPGWPEITLYRFHYFSQCRSLIEAHDYCFYIDVDSIFIKIIDESILPPEGMIGTIHPGLYGGEGTPERNPQSLAHIPYGSGNDYFCGGFFGGSSQRFISMSRDLKEAIDNDKDRGIIAIWHDESHLNKYFFIHRPEMILRHPFAGAESLTPTNNESRVWFLDKNLLGGHSYFRS